MQNSNNFAIQVVLVQDCVCMFLIHDRSPHAAGGRYLYTNHYHTHSVGKLVEYSPPPHYYYFNLFVHILLQGSRRRV